MTVLGETTASSPEKAVMRVSSRSVKPDRYSNAPSRGYVAVAKSNWNSFVQE